MGYTLYVCLNESNLTWFSSTTKFLRMIERSGFQNNMIYDNGKKIFSDKTQLFGTNLWINWDLKLPFAP